MMSVKAVFAVSMTAIGASTLGVSAYLGTHPTVSTTSPAVEAELGPLPRSRFEFVARSMDADTSTVAGELQLDPVTIYGGDYAGRIGALQPPKAVLQPCSAWHSLASGPASRRVKELCVRAPE